MDVVKREKPEIVVHELTSIKDFDMRNFDRGFAETNRFAGWPYERAGGPIKTEEDPLDPNPPTTFRRTLEAICHLAVTGETGLEGVVLRYGSLYGPGTAISERGWMVNDIRKRRVPIIGGGGGVWSFTHVDDAARFTRAAVERGAPGVYNIVDDDPAPVSQWLPPLAEALGAKPPRRIPAWIARFMIGDAVMFMMMCGAPRTPRPSKPLA